MAKKQSVRKLPVAPAIPQSRQIQQFYDELLALPNVIGCFIGRRRRRGRRTREIALIACVSSKPELSAIRKADRIPRRLSWAIGSKQKTSIGVDVQVATAGEMHSLVLGAGDQIVGVRMPGGQPVATLGTIGIAMDHPRYGRVVTTAGHVIAGSTPGETVYGPGQEPEISMRCAPGGSVLTGLAHKVAITGDADYAIVAPPPGVPVDNLYQDSQPLGTPYVPDVSDIDGPAYFLGTESIRLTHLRGIHGFLNVEGLNFTDLLITDICTIGGDSGGCLVTEGSRPMGLVEGVTSLNNRLVSVFTSIVWPLIREGATTF